MLLGCKTTTNKLDIAMWGMEENHTKISPLGSGLQRIIYSKLLTTVRINDSIMPLSHKKIKFRMGSKVISGWVPTFYSAHKW